ncbi:uncharacterized protein [Haliotis cracherodii]|uniref:uncharacterized protein n=1 Tax=Haliotis cracherodii TaxID=6455 RepID=UPI0039EA96F0
MGSPLSPIITEIYMTDLEETALHTSPRFRKVNDTFVILQPDHDPKTLLNHLNAQHPRMQFTMEEEAERQLPFLDVRVQKDPDNKLHTSVYRKPTHTDHYLHNSSYHPPQIKRGIIATLARHAVNICSMPQWQAPYI